MNSGNNLGNSVDEGSSISSMPSTGDRENKHSFLTKCFLHPDHLRNDEDGPSHMKIDSDNSTFNATESNICNDFNDADILTLTEFLGEEETTIAKEQVECTSLNKKNEISHDKELSLSQINGNIYSSDHPNRRRFLPTYFHALTYDGKEVDDFELQHDIFTILFVSPLFSAASLFSLIIFAFQLMILCLVLTNLMHDGYPGNKFLVPLDIKAEVAITQVLTLFISIFTAKDVINALDVFQVEYETSILETFPAATLSKWIITNILRFAEGCLVLIITFIFIVQSFDVLDLILNFAVMQFVSELASLGFYLAERGYSLLDIKEAAVKAQGITFRQVKDFKLCCTNHTRIKVSSSQRIIFFPILIAFFTGWAFIMYRQITGYYFSGGKKKYIEQVK